MSDFESSIRNCESLDLACLKPVGGLVGSCRYMKMESPVNANDRQLFQLACLGLLRDCGIAPVL